MKEQLGVTDEEWKTLKPLVDKVNALSMQTRSMGPRRPRRVPEGEEAPKLSDTQKAAGELRTLLNNQEATPEEIKAALTALREAREKAEVELATARAELLKAVTPRQEARLVLMGTLN